MTSRLTCSALTCASLCVLLIGPKVVAQTEQPRGERHAWLAAGLGPGVFLTGANDLAFAGDGSFTYNFGANVIVARAAGVAELFGSGAVDIGLLYGRAHQAAHIRTSIAVGLALVHGCRATSTVVLGGTCPQVPWSVGVPVEIQASWLAGSELGLGLVGFADVNRRLPFVGASLSILLGGLR